MKCYHHLLVVVAFYVLLSLALIWQIDFTYRPAKACVLVLTQSAGILDHACIT